MTQRVIVLFSVLMIPSFVACDAQEAPPAAAEQKADDPVAVEMARLKAEREAAKKAEEEAETARVAAIEKFASIPADAKAPKNIEKACEAVSAANDAYMKRLYTGEALTKWDGAKTTQLAMQKAGCVKMNSIPVAQCQAAAMGVVTEEYKKELPDLLKRCIEKYRVLDGAGADPAAAPAKK